MFSKIKSMFRRQSTVTITNRSTTVNNRGTTTTTATATATAIKLKKETGGPVYEVVVPGHETVRVRQPNKGEARKFVRDSLGLKRLPNGTTVEKV